MKAFFVFAPIVTLFVVGLVITLKSGEVATGMVGNIRVFAENLSGLVFRLAAYVAVLLAVQYAVGFPMPHGLSW